ncbi:MAG: hypothetical protein U1F54_18120 [Burkholderiales bacterium]
MSTGDDNGVRLQRAIEKNLADLSNSVLKRRAYNAFLSRRTSHSLDFYRIAIHALHNDMFADASRVFDRHKDAASLWYIHRVTPEDFEAAAKAAGVSLARLGELAAKLHPIRNEVLAHTPKASVVDPTKTWERADMSGNEFIELTEGAYEVLRLLYLQLTGEDRPIPEYSGEDTADIAKYLLSRWSG